MAMRKQFDLLKIEVSEGGALKATYEDYDMETWDESPPGVKLEISSEDKQAIQLDIDKLNEGQLQNEALALLGERLFRILFPFEIRKIFDQALTNVDRPQDKRGLRILIEYSSNAAIADWPLELLRRPRPSPIWLATDERLSLSRKIHHGGGGGGGDKRPPLRVLLVVSSPKGESPVMTGKVLESILDWAEKSRGPSQAGEQQQSIPRTHRAISQESEESAPIEVKLLGRVPNFVRSEGDVYLDHPASYRTFREIFSDWQPQVLHFIGHGDVQKNKYMRLAFVNPVTEEAQWINTSDLRQIIAPDSSNLRLVVLQVCKSATNETQLTLASAMVGLNIPAVVAMQFEIDNYCAVTFASHFYQALARKNDVAYAVQLARFQITQVENPENKEPLFWKNREFCTPVVFTHRPGTIIESNPAKTQHFSGPVSSVWPGHQSSVDEILELYHADLANYRSIGDQDMVDFLQKKIDSLKKTDKDLI